MRSETASDPLHACMASPSVTSPKSQDAPQQNEHLPLFIFLLPHIFTFLSSYQRLKSSRKSQVLVYLKGSGVFVYQGVSCK